MHHLLERERERNCGQAYHLLPCQFSPKMWRCRFFAPWVGIAEDPVTGEAFVCVSVFCLFVCACASLPVSHVLCLLCVCVSDRAYERQIMQQGSGIHTRDGAMLYLRSYCIHTAEIKIHTKGMHMPVKLSRFCACAWTHQVMLLPS